MTVSVLVASSFPESRNRNLSIVKHLSEGFSEIIGSENVHCLPFLGLSYQVDMIRPTLVILVGSCLSPQSDYREIAISCRKAGSIFAYWTVEDPYEFDVHDKFSKHADIIFSNDAWAARFYDRSEVYHLPTAASSRFLKKVEYFYDRSLEVFFCGVGFSNRQMIIVDTLPILEQRRTLILGENWPEHPGGILKNKRIKNEDIFNYYSSSKYVLNIGRVFSYANSRRSLPAVTPGPRTFEAAMAGCIQLYYQPSSFLSDYFDIDREIITFDSAAELEEKLRQLDANPNAHLIAEAAQMRAVKEHTYAERAKTILLHAKLFEPPLSSQPVTQNDQECLNRHISNQHVSSENMSNTDFRNNVLPKRLRRKKNC